MLRPAIPLTCLCLVGGTAYGQTWESCLAHGEDHSQCLCGLGFDRDLELVGIWIEVSGGTPEWVQNQLADDTTAISVEQTQNRITLHADGRFTTDPTQTNLILDQQRSDGTAVGTAENRLLLTGLWSTHDNRLYFCPTFMNFSGSAMASMPDGTINTLQMPSLPLIDWSMGYAVRGTRLQTIQAEPGINPIETFYQRR